MQIKKILFLLIATLISTANAFAHGEDGVSRIAGADCAVIKGQYPFNSVVAMVGENNSARVYFYSGARNPIRPDVNLVASGTGETYTMTGFPNRSGQTVVIRLEEKLARFVGLPRLVLSSKILNADSEIPQRGFLANPMTEDEDIDLRCFMDLRPSDLDLDHINSDHLQPVKQASLCAIEFRDVRTPAWTHGCTAAVIGEKTLLSAAHCKEMYAQAEVRVRCGDDPRYFEVAQWTANPAYRPKDHPVANPQDVSVLTLAQSVNAPILAVEASVADSERMILENHRCRHYGMGARQDGTIGNLFVSAYHPPDELLGGKSFVSQIFSMTKMIASDPNRFMRSGDSGGPLVCENARGQDVIVGVHSFLSLPSTSAMSAMTSRNIEFIHSKIKN